MSVCSLAASKLIEKIYACAADVARWPEALEDIRRTFGAAYACLAVKSSDSEMASSIVHTPGDDSLAQKRLPMLAMQTPEIERIVKAPLDAAFSALNLLGEAAFHATPLYRHWAAPNGLRDGAMMKYAEDGDYIAVLALASDAARAPFTPEDLRALECLGPHLRQAARLANVFEDARRQAKLATAVIDMMSCAVFFVDRDGRLIRANRAGAREIELASRLRRCEAGYLRAIDARSAPDLRKAIADAAREKRCASLPIFSNASGATACVAPLPPKSDGGQDAGAVVFMTTACRKLPSPEILMALFDLTPSQANAMLLLGQGFTPAQAAAHTRISLTTMRTHIARLYERTGATHYTDLLNMFRAQVLPLDADVMRIHSDA